MRRTILLCILAVTAVAAAVDVGVRRSPRRVYPAESYWLPRGVGVVAQGYLNTMQSHKILNDIASHDIRIANLWVRSRPFTKFKDDMDLVWTHPDFDVLVIRFESWGSLEDHCDGGRSMIWENEPTAWIVNTLYDLYGDQDKIIVIQNWEADWQLHGASCREREECVSYGWWADGCMEACAKWMQDDPDASVGCQLWGACEEECRVFCCDDLKISRGQYLLGILNNRQKVVREAREANPRARLKVYHSISINFYTDEWLTVTGDIIPLMDEPPDLIGVSHWKRTVPMTDALDYVEQHTGLPRHRIYVAELGEREKQEGDQYARIYAEGQAAFIWGSPIVLVWHWKTWDGNLAQQQLALFDHETFEPKSGLMAVKELNDEWR